MTQDFAKKKRTSPSKTPRKAKTTTRKKSQPRKASPRKSNQRKAKPSNKAPAWAWLIIGLLLAALVTLLIYLANQPKAKEATTTDTPQPQVEKTTEDKPPQPRFDFYQILKEHEEEVPDRSDEVIAAVPENLRYFLQASSFRNREDADKLRAELLLLNLEANIETSSSSGKPWYRVVVGPFKSRSKMAKARSILASQNMNPLLLKRKIQ